MSARFRTVSPEMFLAGAVIISLTMAGVLSQIPGLAFGGFLVMAGVLVAADLVLYILMKVGVIKAPRHNGST